jgi:hypothetical protein
MHEHRIAFMHGGVKSNQTADMAKRPEGSMIKEIDD